LGFGFELKFQINGGGDNTSDFQFTESIASFSYPKWINGLLSVFIGKLTPLLFTFAHD
jgi:hypothetical protein